MRLSRLWYPGSDGFIAMMLYLLASHAVPYSSTIRVAMITVSAFCAFLARGSRKARTPFETASTPVIAAQPLENAFRSSHQLNTLMVGGSGAGICAAGTGCPPACNTL